tara:strand:+ start:2340 stop:3068 length:729 start_codon:yes stop_codon:yes gene_type:complete
LNQQKNINFCFVKYGEEVQGRPINHWIEPLCEPIKEYCNDVKFWCLTDDNRDLPDYINTIPLTNEDIHLHIHWNKIKFFDPSFIKAQPNDETIIVDIDMEWNKNPAPVIEYPIKSKEFVSMNRWWRDDDMPISGNFYKFKSHDFDFIQNVYMESFQHWQEHFSFKYNLLPKFGEQYFVYECVKTYNVTLQPAEWCMKTNPTNYPLYAERFKKETGKDYYDCWDEAIWHYRNVRRDEEYDKKT